MRARSRIRATLAALALAVASAAAAQSNHTQTADRAQLEPCTIGAAFSAPPGAPSGLLPNRD
jgi:hypothetical protein